MATGTDAHLPALGEHRRNETGAELQATLSVFSSFGFAGLKDVDCLGKLSGAPGALRSLLPRPGLLS